MAGRSDRLFIVHSHSSPNILLIIFYDLSILVQSASALQCSCQEKHFIWNWIFQDFVLLNVRGKVVANAFTVTSKCSQFDASFEGWLWYFRHVSECLCTEEQKSREPRWPDYLRCHRPLINNPSDVLYGWCPKCRQTHKRMYARVEGWDEVEYNLTPDLLLSSDIREDVILHHHTVSLTITSQYQSNISSVRPGCQTIFW